MSRRRRQMPKKLVKDPEATECEDRVPDQLSSSCVPTFEDIMMRAESEVPGCKERGSEDWHMEDRYHGINELVFDEELVDFTDGESAKRRKSH